MRFPFVVFVVRGGGRLRLLKSDVTPWAAVTRFAAAAADDAEV